MQIAPAPSKGGRSIVTILIVVIVVIFCVGPILLIALLTLLGPAIGNVFSSIKNNFGLLLPLMEPAVAQIKQLL